MDITIKLTQDQAKTLDDLLTSAIFDESFKNQSEYVAFLNRLRQKIAVPLYKSMRKN